MILSIGEEKGLTGNIRKILGSNIIRKGTIGGGSCFFHSLLEATDPDYRKSEFKIRYVELFRKELADKLDTYYKKYGYNKSMKNIGFNKKKFKQLLDSDEWVGQETWIYMSDMFDINIIIFRLESDSIYHDMIIKERPSVIILNVSDCHYEPLFKKRKNGGYTRIFPFKGETVSKIKLNL